MHHCFHGTHLYLHRGVILLDHRVGTVVGRRRYRVSTSKSTKFGLHERPYRRYKLTRITGKWSVTTCTHRIHQWIRQIDMTEIIYNTASQVVSNFVVFNHTVNNQCIIMTALCLSFSPHCIICNAVSEIVNPTSFGVGINLLCTCRPLTVLGMSALSVLSSTSLFHDTSCK